MDTGDVAWVIAATSLVMLMTPALGFFYGGLVRRKNLVSTIVQCMTIFAIVSLVWAFWGYSEAFAPSVGGGFIGDLSKLGLTGVSASLGSVYSASIPELLYFAFQLKFAAITPALIIGAFAERIRFKALLIFIVLWVTLIYAPIAHWVWGDGGWLRTLGVVDFAGGLVVHLSAAVSAVAAALIIGRRTGIEPATEVRPNNIPFVILGAALLWFGWFGFNAGSALAANSVAVQALVNTNLAAAGAAVSWMLVDWYRKGKPSAVGIAVGAVCGLVAITPAAGYVLTLPAIMIGLVVGVISNLVASWRARTRLDDSLDVFAAHGAGSIWGVLATGLFAAASVNGVNGAFYGNWNQLGLEAFGILVVGAFAFVGAYVLLRVINVFTPVRVSAEEEEKGLDESQHGEEAYA
ncbi:MAG TPA: ammonium transporter [Candidatus Bathyarchaeia archaeon]|nr:ammonium transporter [Candidatus Bathyarchaeia archaeon]